MDLNPRHGQVALMNLGPAWANSPRTSGWA